MAIDAAMARGLAATVLAAALASAALSGCTAVANLDLRAAAEDGRNLPVRFVEADVTGADPARGRELARAPYGCGACHVIPGVTGATGMVGPPLTGWSRRVYISGRLPNTPEHLIRWIREPQAIEPGTAMPDLGVSEADARDIAAYLFSIR